MIEISKVKQPFEKIEVSVQPYWCSSCKRGDGDTIFYAYAYFDSQTGKVVNLVCLMCGQSNTALREQLAHLKQ